jgi:hypothetical protein
MQQYYLLDTGKYSKGNRIMATIKTPAAGVSPYQEAAAAPVVLRADANGNTVLANPTVAATAAATNANTNVIVNGNEALNSLIATSRSGVFEGANVTINLEEQLFNTTNQVTATTNYPSGNTGEIQFNSGSNSFASNAYFTYDNSNVITPGIRTDGYFYSNGSPFIGGGNAAIGNFVFTGDAMTIAHANSTLSVTGNGTGNIQVSSNSNVWVFNNVGNLTLPSNTSSINYANGSPYGGTNYSNSNVSSFLAAFGSNVVSTTGNITGNYFIGNGSQLTGISTGLPLANGTSNINIATANGNVTITANVGNTWTFGDDGNLTLPGNIIAINYANGNRITGNVTFSSEIVIGTGTSNLISGLYLAPSSSSANANMYLRVRGNINDEPTHIHFDTGNNAYYNQFIGDDNKYIQLANTGNIVINSNDVAGNAAQWTFDYDGYLTLPADATISDFGDTASLNVDGSSRVAQLYWNGNIGNGNPDIGSDYYTWAYVGDEGFFIRHKNTSTSTNNQWQFGTDGNLTFPTGNLVIIPDYASESNAAVISSTDHVLALLATGVNGGVQSVWTEDIGNIGTSNTAAVRVSPTSQTGNIQIQTGNNSSINTWTFDNLGSLTTPGSSGNITGANVITANVFAMTHGGNITEGTIPAYTSLTGNTIVLTPSSGTSADQQLVIYPTANIGDGNHLHLTSGNLYNTELFLGDDFLYVKLANTGNIVINSNNNVGNSAQWTFDTGGMLIFPTGNLIITPDYAAFGNAAVISSADHNLITGSFGANGGTSSLWVEDVANIGTSNIAAVYANPVPGSGNVRIAVGTNGGAGPNLWDFTPTGVLTAPGNITFLGDASSAPWLNNFNVSAVNINATAGNLAVANGGAGGASGGYISATRDISATGNITGNYFIGNGSQLTDVGAASVPGQNILPTIQTITVADTSGVGNSGGGGLGYANVTVANITPVTEYGVIITSGTSSQKYATGALGSIPGTVKLSFTTGLNSTPFTVYAYVTSNAGTYYSNSATGTSGICLLAGTQIALSDGTHKAIEHITYTDKLLSWDFDRGCYAETTALWIKRSETGSQYNLLTFSDGTTLRTFDQHRIFNKQAGAFTYPMTDATPIGTVTVNEHGQEIILTNKQVIQDTIEYYNVITDYHMNLFSDSVLTSCRFNNIYPITDMKFAKDGRTLRTRAEFKNVEDRFFHGLRLAEQTADIKTVEWYVDRLLATEVSTQSELAF